MAGRANAKKFKYDIGVYSESSRILGSVQTVIEECAAAFPDVDMRIVLCRDLATIASLSLMRIENFQVLILLLDGSESALLPEGVCALKRLPAERLLIRGPSQGGENGDIPYSSIRSLVYESLTNEAGHAASVQRPKQD